MTRPAMAADPMIAALDAARERGCTRAVLLTEDAEGAISMHSAGDWSGLELRGLAVLLCEIVSEQEGEGD